MMRSLTVGTAISIATASVAMGQSAFVDLGETRIHYVTAGAGHPVVLIHGWALNHREWDDQVAALSPHFRVVAYDRRGCGKSTGFPDASADPGDLRDLLDSLGIARAVLMGHSAGGDVARRFAAAFPERVAALVLYPLGSLPRGFPLPPDLRRPSLPDRSAIARQHGIDSLFRIVSSRPEFRESPRRRPELRARLDTILRAYAGRDLLEDHTPSGRYQPPTLKAMKRWCFPVLFLMGESETAMAHLVSDSLSRWLPNARKVVIPGGGHGVHFDEPERFNEALMVFLRDVQQPGPAP
ncbi:MAG TPA: alpha/beta hydrolase [Gemmatimonadaceae bacterium]|nr:alpha/beta hydrolase [Gemmatimonadaceae bacterium]